jgi:hypothetical protein
MGGGPPASPSHASVAHRLGVRDMRLLADAANDGRQARESVLPASTIRRTGWLLTPSMPARGRLIPPREPTLPESCGHSGG